MYKYILYTFYISFKTTYDRFDVIMLKYVIYRNEMAGIRWTDLKSLRV